VKASDITLFSRLLGLFFTGFQESSAGGFRTSAEDCRIILEWVSGPFFIGFQGSSAVVPRIFLQWFSGLLQRFLEFFFNGFQDPSLVFRVLLQWFPGLFSGRFQDYSPMGFRTFLQFPTQPQNTRT
jgi:hypothetical protein